MSRKKKKLRFLIVLIVLLTGCLALFFAVKNKNAAKAEADEAAEEENEKIIAEIPSDDIIGISYSRDGESMSFEKDEEGVWKVKGDESFPLSNSAVTNMAAGFGKLTYSVIVPDAENLDDFGLAEPYISFTLRTAEKEITISLGEEYPLGTMRYAKCDGDNNVYVIASTYYTKFDKSRGDLIELPVFPEISAEDIDSVELNLPGHNACRIYYDESGSFDMSGFYPWTVAYEGGNTFVLDSDDATETLLPVYAGMGFEKAVDFGSECFAEYGLESPSGEIVIEYSSSDVADSTEDTGSEDAASAAVKILIGNSNEDGDYYAYLDGTDIVCLLGADTVDSLAADDAAAEYTAGYVSLLAIKDFARASVKSAGAEHIYETGVGTGKQSDGSESEITTYYIDGAETDESSFKNIYSMLIGVGTHDLFIYDSPDPAELGEPLLSIDFKTDKKHFENFEIAYYPYDNNYYAASVKGTVLYLVDRRDIDEIVSSLFE